MNKSFFLVLVPPLLVVAGYLALFHYMKIEPRYFRLFVATAGFFGALWWVRRRGTRKAKPAGR